MTTITEIALINTERGIFTRRQASFWVGNSEERLNALLKRAVASGEVLRIRRNLFCLSTLYIHHQINSFELAQQIHGPSYISLESALSFYGWIPEAVHTISSITLQRSRTFNTPLGMFSFTRIPQPKLFSGVNRISDKNGASYFMSTPLKALADYVYVNKCDWDSVTPLMESLRIDENSLEDLTAESFDQLMPMQTTDRQRNFLRGLRKDLQL